MRDDNKYINNDFEYDEYSIILKRKKDILEEVEFENEEEALICDSIITNLEKDIATAVNNMQVANIPYIGCIRINPVRREMRDNYKNFRIARTQMTKEQYKEHARAFYNDAYMKMKENDKRKKVILNIKRKNKKKYETLYSKLGKSYANMYVYSIYLLKDVPFDSEWEKQYQKLKDET